MHGSPHRIIDFANSELGAIGVSHLQVRLSRAVGDEQCDQIAAFGAEVGPHLTRTQLDLRSIVDGRSLDAARLPRPAVRARVDVARSTRPRSSSSSGPISTASTRSCSPSTTASTTAGCPAPLTMAGGGARRARSARGDGERGDPAVARPDPHRRADRGARQRVPGSALDRVRCGLPRRGVRDGRTRARGARPHPRRARRRSCSRRWQGEPFEWRGRDVCVTPKPVTDPRPDVVRRWRSARRGAPRRASAAADVPDEHRPRRCCDAYYDEAKKVGFTEGFVIAPGRPDLRARRRRSRPGLGRDRPVRALRGADVRVVPDPGQHSLPGGERRDGRRPEDARRSIWSVRPTTSPPRSQALPDMAGVVFNPLAGGMPPGARLVEPRALRGEGVRASARHSSRVTRICKAAISAYRRASPRGEVRDGSLPPLRRYPVLADEPEAAAPSSTTCALRRAGLKTAMSGLELALAAPAPNRARVGRAACARARRRCTTCGRVTSSRPKRQVRSSTSWSPTRPRLATPASRLRREHSEILATITRAEQATRRVAGRRRPTTRGSTGCATELTSLLVGTRPNHRQRGADLIYEAYDVDIGGGF